MPRFFAENIFDKEVFLSKEDMHHLTKVLRVRNGEEIVICNKKGTDYLCKTEILQNEVTLKIISSKPTETEPRLSITLFQALPKSDKMNLIIQKAVELGVVKIVPFISKFCVSRPDEKNIDKKVERWNKISYEASKQCGRGIIPEICDVISFEEAVLQSKNYELSLICYENGGRNLNDFNFKSLKSACFFIGSEGGFSEEEIAFAQRENLEKITLGKRILRCETAPLVSLAIMLNLSGDM